MSLPMLITRDARRDAWVFFGLAVLVLGAGLGLRDPWPADEPRFALVARQMVEAGESGSVVTILCDGGERYATSYYCEAWLADQGYELVPLIDRVAACVEQGGALPDIPRSGL